jgi:hypothetical protein
MNIEEKYQTIRPSIKDGDLVLFRGTKLLAKIIQNCDKAYFNHIGIVMETHGALLIVDSQAEGVVADRLSKRIKDYKNGDFCVILSIEKVLDAELDRIMERQDKKDILYDYGNGFKELMNRKFGWNLKIKANEDKDICSDFVYEYALRNKFILPFENRVAFPMDYIRHRDKDNTLVFGY